jgi:hypothetical protein
MTRRVALVVLGAVTIGLFVFLAGKDDEMRDTGGPGIVPFEVAFDRERAEEIKADWDSVGQDAARVSLIVDYLFLFAYGAFLVLAAAATRDGAARLGWDRMERAGALAVPAAVAAATFDAIENAWLLITLETRAGDLAPLAAGVFACLKFAASAFVVAYILAGLVLRLRAPRPTRA